MIKQKLIQLIIKLLPVSIKFRITLPYRLQLAQADNYYSQNGEDILLLRYFNRIEKGFYVDVGAHNPVRFSNTLKLYQKGWRGINIDALPGSKNIFDEIRPEDINLELGISESKSSLEYFMFNEPALNTFDPQVAKRKDGKQGYLIEQTKLIQTYSLSEVLDTYLPSNRTIDYLNIDVEGLDFQVLRSNNWDKYSPSVITIESNDSWENVTENDTYRLLKTKGYLLNSIVFNTLLFIRNDFSPNRPIRI